MSEVPKRTDPEGDRVRAVKNAARAARKTLEAERTEAAAYAYAMSLGASLRELAGATGRPHMTVKRIAERAHRQAAS